MIFTVISVDENTEAENLPLQWKGIEPYKESSQNKNIGFFAEMDVKTDYSAAVKAINAGRRAAVSIHMIMNGLPVVAPETIITPESTIQNIESLENVKTMPRQVMPLYQSEDLEMCDEFEKGFDDETAAAEAKRCLQCGLICYKNSIN